MNTPRRRFLSTLVAGSYVSSLPLSLRGATNSMSWHEEIADKARLLSTDQTLRKLIPWGSGLTFWQQQMSSHG